MLSMSEQTPMQLLMEVDGLIRKAESLRRTQRQQNAPYSLVGPLLELLDKLYGYRAILRWHTGYIERQQHSAAMVAMRGLGRHEVRSRAGMLRMLQAAYGSKTHFRWAWPAKDVARAHLATPIIPDGIRFVDSRTDDLLDRATAWTGDPTIRGQADEQARRLLAFAVSFNGRPVVGRKQGPE